MDLNFIFIFYSHFILIEESANNWSLEIGQTETIDITLVTRVKLRRGQVLGLPVSTQQSGGARGHQ